MVHWTPLIIHIVVKRKVIIFVISNAGTTGPGSDFEFLEVPHYQFPNLSTPHFLYFAVCVEYSDKINYS